MLPAVHAAYEIASQECTALNWNSNSTQPSLLWPDHLHSVWISQHINRNVTMLHETHNAIHYVEILVIIYI